ncbi:spatacsin [Dunckerocampus dactyliophorus]|uniref:spatacsin n=1 Tax=Dunckerocampus dactyliophorus TaxID=161453 RepID=UPI002407006A|nr:spatacsin [Dunckerocampus dactyliophorus]
MEDSSCIEVALIPENQHCREVADVLKAQLAPSETLLGCLELGGTLMVWDPANREVTPVTIDGCYQDFSWEEASGHHGVGGALHLLAVGSCCKLAMLEVDTERISSLSVHCIHECPAEHLQQAVSEWDQRLKVARVLSYVSGRCCLLMDAIWLLEIMWSPMQKMPQTLTCCRITPMDGTTVAHCCVCDNTAFALSESGLISVYNITNGVLLATINLPASLSPALMGEELVSSSCSFCLLEVSADLSTAVAVTHAHVAVAVDLNDYFKRNPDHLLCEAAATHAPLRPQQPSDEDSLASSSCNIATLGWSFNTDRSWGSHLTTMYNTAQQPALSSFSACSAATSWSSSLPSWGPHQPLPSAQSRVPPGGASVTFAVPESSVPSLLSVSEFSAMLTFVSPRNMWTASVLWDLQSRNVTYHQTEGQAAPVELCGERHHTLLLKKAGMFQVLFSVSQQDLLTRLMLFGSAATVDAVCHLNSWGRCSIPIHSLKAGVKNRQLDTVDFYLKSKENLLKTLSSSSLKERVQTLCPALDLLCSAIRESNSDAQSRQFSEQLLHITLNFVSAQIRYVLTHMHYEDENVRSCVDVLNKYLAELRTFMKKYPWLVGGDPHKDDAPADEEDKWELLPIEELVRLSVLTNDIPRAQAALRKRGHPEWRLSAIRAVGLRQVFSCLQQRDLQTAKVLLTNMGLNVKKELHRICIYTDNKDLREFVGEELSRQAYFSEEESQGVVFIKEVERLLALPASRHTHVHCSSRVVEVFLRESGGGEVLEEVLGQRSFEEDDEESALCHNVRLDWVKNWNQSSRTAILLSRHQPSDFSMCDAGVLWRHMTTLHNRCGVVDWIESSEGSGASRWPELTPAVVNNNMLCSFFLTEDILDLLARRGVFIPDELADLERLLWRLAQGEGLMSCSLPLPQHRSPHGLDLHALVISWCLERGLQYLLYVYLEHYRLTPRNCPLLAGGSTQTQPWFDMLVKIQEISRDLTDPGMVFQASLTSAQVLLPGSPPSLSSLLLEGHSLLALATIMFSPGGVDQVVLRAERSTSSECSVDPQLMKMALTAYPKLKAALFPAGPRGPGPFSDISIYHLLQSLHPLDPCRLFGWQAANSLNSSETTELPHFSSPQLVDSFALVDNLDYLYYVQHGRPSFAFATFLLQELIGCDDVSLLLQQALQHVHGLAVQSFNTASVVAAAVCFCELLGVSSLQLRVDVKVMNAILTHWTQYNTRCGYTQPLQTLVSKGVKLVEAEPGAAEELIGYLEAAVMDSLGEKAVSRSSWEAAQEWALPVQFCHLHALTLSSVYPAHCARDGQYIHFLLFVQLHNFPPQQVRSLVAQFGPTLQEHLRLAFQNLQVFNQGSLGVQESPRELFQVLLRSQEVAGPSRYLLREALGQRCSTLTVLASCTQDAELLQCLCVWLLTSIDVVTAEEATSHLADLPQHHKWTLHDLSIIWRTLLGKGLVRPLLRGFQLFQKDCPLLAVLSMFELCCDYKNFSEAKVKLLDFQRTLVTLRSSNQAPPGGLSLQWLESQASTLLIILLQRCSSQYHLHRLLLLLADVDKFLKTDGLDFTKLSQLSQLLQGSDVSVPLRLLQCNSSSIQKLEFQATVDALQSRGFYSQARQVAMLAGLPVHRLLLCQLLQEVQCQRSKRQWSRLETRVTFWRRCHQQLQAETADPESASQFFLSQAESLRSDPSVVPEAQSELLAVRERCLLLGIAAHWLSQCNPAPADQLQILEKKVWISWVRQHALVAAMERQSVFNLPLPAVTPDMNTYEVLMKEFSFSNISELNTDTLLSLEGLPGPAEEHLDVDPVLNPAEKNTLAVLVDGLLDKGSIHEASRVCRYFSLYHPDVWLVLRCRGLASGELSFETRDMPEGPPMRLLHTSPSLSSLSSFVMLPLPEDKLAPQLQKLVDQCSHGNNYCKQVLSLYQLSKELQCSFSHMTREDPRCVLEKLLLSEHSERFRNAQVFIKAQSFSAEVVAELVASALVHELQAAAQELHLERQAFRPTEGRDSLIQLITLCEDPNLVGMKVLEKLKSIPLRDLSCIVELLIVAHDCFSLTCNMEGIVRVLQAARHISHAYLAPSENYGLLVRLLTGMGRYNEMTYVFDLLHQNHRFEMLLRKKMDTDRGQSSSLKTALLDYIKRCLPADSEKYNMVALCFSMRREIGENHEMAARTQLKIIESQPWVVSPELKSSLLKVLSLLKDAAESFSKDACVHQASRCVRTAKLVTLQLHFLNQGSDLRVVNLRPADMHHAVMALPRCYQVLVVSEAYSYSPDWVEIVYNKVLLNGDFAYLEELKRHRPLTSSLFQDIFDKLDGAPSGVTANARRLLAYCDDVYMRYRLAYQRNLHDVTKTLLQDAMTSSYLNDKIS